MKAKITGLTTECKTILGDTDENISIINEYIKESFCSFSGKNAGICYMSDEYKTIENEGITKSLNRFNRTISSTHHSIADHCFATVVFEEVPKFFAMILNSFQFYNTSEKSARYTKMGDLSLIEQKLYDKWNDKLTKILITKGADEKHAMKIAQENARYFISIFSPSTTLSYTTSIRQWNYIYIWFKRFIRDSWVDGPQREYLYSKTISFMKDFIVWFEGTPMFIDTFDEPKSREIDFIYKLYGDRYYGKPRYTVENCSDSYNVMYEVSFSALAQLQRHRTIKYIINDFEVNNTSLVYIPKLVSLDTKLSKEWVSDMTSELWLYPQGRLIEVVEFGTIDNFLLKCDERLCGRTQLETMQNVKNVLMKLYYNKDDMSKYSADKLCKWIDNGRIRAKCELRKGGCSDRGCEHGPKNATNRKW